MRPPPSFRRRRLREGRAETYAKAAVCNLQTRSLSRVWRRGSWVSVTSEMFSLPADYAGLRRPRWPCYNRRDRSGGRSDESDRDHIRARENACIDLLDWLHLARHCLEPQGSSKLFVSDATVASPSAETRRPPAWARQEPAGQCVASPSA